MQKRGFPVDILEKAGLVIQREGNEGYFDRFRGRVIFPLHNAKGQVVAFSGRTLGDEKPKYLNSPETPIFNKSSLLFNFHRARPNIRKLQQAILFEGFADVMAAHRAGLHNGIATMGTSLTDQHIQQIKRVSNQVLICYDGDSAGIQAAYRAATQLEENGCEVKVALLPEKLDPDEYIRTYGEDKFRQSVVEGSLTLMAFKMQYYKIGKNMQDEGQRLHYIEQVLAEITKLTKAVERDLYLRQIADQFSLSLEALKQQQTQLFYQERKKNPNRFNRDVKLVVSQRQQKLFPAYQTAERRLIAYMLKDDETAYKVKELLGGQTFNIDEHQAIFTYLLGFYEEGHEPDTSSFLSYLPDVNLRNYVSEIEMMSVSDSISDEEMNDYIKEVLKHQKLLKIKEKKEQQKEAERHSDYKKAAELAMEIVHLQKML